MISIRREKKTSWIVAIFSQEKQSNWRPPSPNSMLLIKPYWNVSSWKSDFLNTHLGFHFLPSFIDPPFFLPPRPCGSWPVFLYRSSRPILTVRLSACLFVPLIAAAIQAIWLAYIASILWPFPSFFFSVQLGHLSQPLHFANLLLSHEWRLTRLSQLDDCL